jgi:hypothetical protein
LQFNRKSQRPEFRKRIRTVNHRVTKTRNSPALLRIVGRSARWTTVAVIALVGCASNFAATDSDDDPDTPDAADIVMAQPAALEVIVVLRERAQIPRKIGRNIFGASAPGIDRVAATSVKNFYCLHKHIRERAPPPLVLLQ